MTKRMFDLKATDDLVEFWCSVRLPFEPAISLSANLLIDYDAKCE